MGFDYPHLALSSWPFSVVPDESSATFMADRHQVKADVEVLLRTLTRRPQVSLHLLWSWFGSGKTHVLHYIAHRCNSSFPNILPIYSEFPRAPKSFVDVYLGFISGVDVEKVANTFFQMKDDSRRSRMEKEFEIAFPDFWNAIKMLYIGDVEDKEAIRKWFRLESQDGKRLANCGITKKLDRPEDAVRLLTFVIRILGAAAEAGGTIGRVLWMIDEYQRIAKVRAPIRDEINGSLQSAFNRSAKYFSIILSFSGKPVKTVPDWISNDLVHRIGAEKTIVLPPLSDEESLSFISEVLNHHRLVGKKSISPFFPFTEQSAKRAVQLVGKKTELRPRRLMEAFDSLLREADLEMEDGRLDFVDDAFVERNLKDIQFLGEEE